MLTTITQQPATTNASLSTLNSITNPYLKKVFEVPANNVKMLSINEFIRLSEYPIDNFMVDRFFNNLNDDIPMYVDDGLIEWCGFSGELRTQKSYFQKILKKKFEKGVDYWVFSNKEYQQYYKL